MKHWMATAAAFALLTGITAANAQNAPAATPNNTTAQQPASSQPNHRASVKRSSNKHAMKSHKPRHRVVMLRKSHPTTTGAARNGTIGGAQNDPSIHQSKQRDSRGTPKGTGSDQNK